MKQISKIVRVIMGTLIGAGFASGREIYLFFGKFGLWGLIGILLSGIVTAGIINRLLEIVKENKIDTYADLLSILNPRYSKINYFINLVVTAFLLISFYIMIAGFCAYMEQTYYIPSYISSIFFVFICYFVFQKSLQGMMKINSFLVPVLIFFIFYLGIQNIPYLITNYNIVQIPTTANRLVYQ